MIQALLRLTVLSLLLAGPVWAEDGVALTYRGANKWLTAGDSAPLKALMNAAQNGQTRFEARLPEAQRELATARLEVLRDLLAQKDRAVLIEESEGPAAAPNTLWIK